MADLAKLTVRLEAENAKLHKALEASQRSVQSFAKKSQAAATAVGVAFGTMAADAAKSLARFASEAISVAADTGRWAEIAGVTAESLTRLGAAVPHIPLETMADALKELTVRAAEAEQGTGEAKEAFASMGVSVTDATGQIKAADSLLLEIADRFTEFADGAGKAAAAEMVMGEVGARLVPTLNLGSQAIRDMGQAAADAGTIMDGEATRSAQAFQAQVAVLTKQGQGLLLDFLVPTLPAFTALAKALGDTSTEVRSTAGSFSVLEGGAKLVAITVNTVTNQIRALGGLVGGLGNAFSNLFAGQFKAAAEAATSAFAAIPAGMRESVTEALEIWDSTQPEMAAAGAAAGAAVVDGYKPQLRLLPAESKKAVQAVRDSITPMIESLQLAAATVGMTSAEIELYKLTLEGASAAQLDAARAALGTVAAWEMQEAAASAAAQAEADRLTMLEGLQSSHIDLITGTTAAQRELIQTQEELGVLLGAGRLSADEYGAAMERLKAGTEGAREGIFDIAEFGKEAARSLQSSFADFLFDPFQGGIEGMAKGFGKVMQRMIAEAVAADLLGRLQGLGGAGGGGIGGAISAFAGFFNQGGMVPRGQFGIAGENGPELVFGGQQVVSTRDTAQMMQGGATNITVNVAPQNNSADMRRAAGLGAREALGALNQARRYG